MINPNRGIAYIFILAVMLFSTAEAQVTDPDTKDLNTAYQISSGMYGSTDDSMPFWFYSNVNGKVDPSSTNWLNELSVDHKLWDSSSISVNIGGNAVFRWSDDSQVLFPRAYIKANAYGLQLDAGRFSQPIGLNNHELSVGSMMVSDNAIPVPKISLSTPEFLHIPFTEGHLQYKGMFSHGWLEEDRHVRGAYLHQKYFYLRVNTGPFSVTGGIVHNAQWGGTDPDSGRLPQSFGDYLRLVVGQGADENSNAPGGEISNVIGNSVAAYDFSLRYKKENFSLSLTRLFYLEDKVSTRFRSPWDGVWGANLVLNDREQWINAVTYEHINTKNQDAKSWELIGRRDYYDNFVYESGWTYENRTLGIPLILFDGNTISNNVLVGHHLGFKGRISENLRYRSVWTYSRNYGVQNDWVDTPSSSIPKDREDIIPREQFRKDQYSMLLGLNYNIRSVAGLAANLKISKDIGELYQDNLGLMIGLKWNNAF